MYLISAILDISTSSAEPSPALMEFLTIELSLGRVFNESPFRTNPSLVLGVLGDGATTLNHTEVVAWKRDGLVTNIRVSSSPGLSTLRRVKSATPLTKGTLVTPPKRGRGLL